jgi:hypothetical protein
MPPAQAVGSLTSQCQGNCTVGSGVQGVRLFGHEPQGFREGLVAGLYRNSQSVAELRVGFAGRNIKAP